MAKKNLLIRSIFLFAVSLFSQDFEENFSWDQEIEEPVKEENIFSLFTSPFSIDKLCKEKGHPAKLHPKTLKILAYRGLFFTMKHPCFPEKLSLAELNHSSGFSWYLSHYRKTNLLQKSFENCRMYPSLKIKLQNNKKAHFFGPSSCEF